MLGFTHVMVGYLLHTQLFLKCYGKSHRTKQVTDGSFLPWKRAHLYVESSGWAEVFVGVSVLEVAGAEEREGPCSTLALALRGTRGADNTSWADWICAASLLSGRRETTSPSMLPRHSWGLETRFSPKGWDSPLPTLAVCSVGASHSLLVPKVPTSFSQILRNKTSRPEVRWQQFHLNCAWMALASPWFLSTKLWPLSSPGSALDFNDEKKPLPTGAHKARLTPAPSPQLWGRKGSILNWIIETQPFPWLFKQTILKSLLNASIFWCFEGWILH